MFPGVLCATKNIWSQRTLRTKKNTKENIKPRGNGARKGIVFFQQRNEKGEWGWLGDVERVDKGRENNFLNSYL